MAIHWNAQGVVDGYGSRFMGVLFFPIVILVLYLFLSLIPYIAVFKENIQDFIQYFFGFKLIFVFFMGSVYAATIVYNLGHYFNMTLFVVPSIAVLLFYVGYIMQFMKRNFFIGIRTPWTLANDEVWKRTHKVGSLTFRLNAIIILFTLIFPNKFLLIVLIPTLGNALFLVVYSYHLYSKIGKKQL